VVPSPAEQAAEVKRLTEEITKLAQRNAWAGVEKAYKALEDKGDAVFGLIPKGLGGVAAVHQYGAEASRILGETQLSQTRLLRAKRSVETTSPIDEKTLRQIIEALDAIEKSYGAVAIAPRSVPTSKRQLKRLQGHGPELIPVVQPFAPDQRRSIETAAKALKDTGSLMGLLPAGGYTVAGQSFTVNAGTELTGKKRTTVLWNN
jgi:hypothetical protein